MIAWILRQLDRASGNFGIEPKKGRFLAVGGVNFAFGISIYPLLLWCLDGVRYGYLLSLALAQAIGLIFAFLTHKTFVFQTDGNIITEFPRFASFYLTAYAINWLALPLLVEIMKFDPTVAQIGFTILMVFASYFWHNYVTFRRGRDDGQADLS